MWTAACSRRLTTWRSATCTARSRLARPTIRYAGSPLKYSFSEASQRKSVTVVTLGEKSAVDVRTVPLTPLRDLREIRGSYDELTARSFYEHTTYRSDYLHLILTDEQDVFDAVGRLRAIYPYLMTLDYDNARTRAAGAVAAPAGHGSSAHRWSCSKRSTYSKTTSP